MVQAKRVDYSQKRGVGKRLLANSRLMLREKLVAPCSLARAVLGAICVRMGTLARAYTSECRR